MLKITMNKTETKDRWTLHGQLRGPWVGELRTVWRNTQGADEHRPCVFDLNDVTFVDTRAGGIYIRGVLGQWR